VLQLPPAARAGVLAEACAQLRVRMVARPPDPRARAQPWLPWQAGPAGAEPPLAAQALRLRRLLERVLGGFA